MPTFMPSKSASPMAAKSTCANQAPTAHLITTLLKKLQKQKKRKKHPLKNHEAAGCSRELKARLFGIQSRIARALLLVSMSPKSNQPSELTSVSSAASDKISPLIITSRSLREKIIKQTHVQYSSASGCAADVVALTSMGQSKNAKPSQLRQKPCITWLMSWRWRASK